MALETVNVTVKAEDGTTKVVQVTYNWAEPATDVVNIGSLNLVNPRSIREAFTKNGLGKRLGLAPNTIYEDPDFASNNGVWNQPSSFSGIVGGGRTTILRIKPGTSTKASQVPAQSTGSTNPLHTLQALSATRDQLYSNFALEGNAGHLHGGMRLRPNAHKIVVEDIWLVDAAPGNYWSPPGETFGINMWHADAGSIVRRIDADGRGNAASLIGYNDCADTYTEDCNLRGAPHGMITWWQCRNIETLRVKSQGGHHGFNHERNTGRILHRNPTATVDRAKSPNGMNFTLNNDLGNASPVDIYDPIVDTGLRSGSVMVQTGTNYRGVPNKQITIPNVWKKGVKLTIVDYGSSVAKPVPDPEKYWWLYR